MWEGALLTSPVETARGCRYLIVVAARDEPLHRYLEARFRDDAGTRVVLDRRRAGPPDGDPGPPGAERRLSRDPKMLSSGIAVIRLTGGRPTTETTATDPAGRRAPATMDSIEGLDDRQRVERWLGECQHLIGRAIPAYLEERERLRAWLATAEKDNERLRIELADARREIDELRGDLDFHRAERARIAENFHTMVEHLTALQRPVNDISSRLQAARPADAEVKV
jgi:hypothetical protein